MFIRICDLVVIVALVSVLFFTVPDARLEHYFFFACGSSYTIYFLWRYRSFVKEKGNG